MVRASSGCRGSFRCSFAKSACSGRRERARRSRPMPLAERLDGTARRAVAPKPGAVLRVGLISDTHGLLRPQATALLRGCNHIIHAGDIGSPDILAELAALAPLTAVRGN